MEMPNKLKVVLGLSAASVALDIFSQSWMSAIVGALIGFALFRGHEAVRTFVLWGSAIGFCFLAVFTVIAILALPITMLAGPLVAIGGVLALGFGAMRCGLTVWVLRQPDVQKWMYARSTGAL